MLSPKYDGRVTNNHLYKELYTAQKRVRRLKDLISKLPRPTNLVSVPPDLIPKQGQVFWYPPQDTYKIVMGYFGNRRIVTTEGENYSLDSLLMETPEAFLIRLSPQTSGFADFSDGSVVGYHRVDRVTVILHSNAIMEGKGHKINIDAITTKSQFIEAVRKCGGVVYLEGS